MMICAAAGRCHYNRLLRQPLIAQLRDNDIHYDDTKNSQSLCQVIH